MAAKQAQALSAGARVSATLVEVTGPKSHVTGSEHNADQRARRVREQVGTMGDVHDTGEEDAVQVRDGPGGPGHEPDLLRRITAPTGQRRRRMARPDVPPQDNRGHGEAGESHQVEGDGTQTPQNPTVSGLPAFFRRDGRFLRLVALARNVVGHRVRRHVHPTRHRRRAYCHALCRRGPVRPFV